jgi:hypothetical protein
VVPSGAPGAFPLVVKVLEAPPRLEPDFATSFNFDAEEPAVLTGVAGAKDGEEVSDREAALAAFFAPKNVLLTETDLKLCGFLTVDEVRTWLGSFVFETDASVSEPPLTLTSAELMRSSTMSLIALFFSGSS